MRHLVIAALLLVFGGPACLPAYAAELRVGNAVDTATMDPHGSTETNTLGTIMNVYEALVRRGPTMALEPSLAVSWTLVEPTRWRFKLRHATFSDGTPFTADDVLFSFERANGPTSEAKPAVRSIKAVEVVSPDTVDIVTTVPTPTLLAEIANFFIMSRAWATAHQSEAPFNPTRNLGTENWATRHANGTGPYMLESYGAGQGVVLVANPHWWDKPTGNVTRATISQVGNDATRVAALLSGSLDLIIPVPEQAAAQVAARPGFKVLRGPRLAVMYLGMDQARPQLLYSDVTGRNPFSDLRVRQAVGLAIDTQALRRVVLHNSVLPAGSLIPEGVEGFAPGMDKATKPDPERARTLLAQAGYPNGFGVTLDCTNDQYPSDEAICTAIVPMLARVGIRATPRIESRARFFPRVTGKDTSIYIMAWYAPTLDAHHILYNTYQTPTKTDGLWNATGYSDPKLDALIQSIGAEMDPAKRRAMIAEANRIVTTAAVYVPLYQLSLAWATKSDVTLVTRPDNRLDLRFVKIGH
jgi:peptide/nickel transport system substrate-binding protein